MYRSTPGYSGIRLGVRPKHFEVTHEKPGLDYTENEAEADESAFGVDTDVGYH